MFTFFFIIVLFMRNVKLRKVKFLINLKYSLEGLMLKLKLQYFGPNIIGVILPFIQFSSVQSSCSVISNSLRPHGLQHARPPHPSPTSRVYSHSCPLSWQYHPTISSYHPFLLLPAIFSSIRVFSNESVLPIRWPKCWSCFSFSISPSNEHPGLISFRMDWLDLLAVQGTLKSLFQHHSSKASILWSSAFFIVQLSHPYTTTGKAIALTRP